MTFGLADVGYSLPDAQAVKLTFFAPCRSFSSILEVYNCSGEWFPSEYKGWQFQWFLNSSQHLLILGMYV